MTLTDRILAENAPAFEAMLAHRFVRDVAGDRLPRAVFDRYLVYEGAFVGTAIRIFALAAARAPGIADQRHLVAVLANGQVAWFEEALAERGLDAAAAETAPPSVAAFRDGTLYIARDGTYLDILAAMFAAEWMYRTCAPPRPARPSPTRSSANG